MRIIGDRYAFFHINRDARSWMTKGAFARGSQQPSMLCRSAYLSKSNLRSLASALKYCASQAVSFPFTLYAALLQECKKVRFLLAMLNVCCCQGVAAGEKTVLCCWIINRKQSV